MTAKTEAAFVLFAGIRPQKTAVGIKIQRLKVFTFKPLEKYSILEGFSCFLHKATAILFP
jgi:hypothetical protein